jgi:hypothetical protein
MFQISPLPHRQFSHLFGKMDEELAAIGIVAMTADSKPGFPCRVSLRDAEPGDAFSCSTMSIRRRTRPIARRMRSS